MHIDADDAIFFILSRMTSSPSLYLDENGDGAFGMVRGVAKGKQLSPYSDRVVIQMTFKLEVTQDLTEYGGIASTMPPYRDHFFFPITG